VAPQAVKSAGAKVVAGFASLDRQLQKAGILPELKPVKLPAEVRDEAGQLASDCAEVGILFLHGISISTNITARQPAGLMAEPVFLTGSQQASAAAAQQQGSDRL